MSIKWSSRLFIYTKYIKNLFNMFKMGREHQPWVSQSNFVSILVHNKIFTQQIVVNMFLLLLLITIYIVIDFFNKIPIHRLEYLLIHQVSFKIHINNVICVLKSTRIYLRSLLYFTHMPYWSNCQQNDQYNLKCCIINWCRSYIYI